MAKIDEDRIKTLILEYQNGNNSVINSIIKEISLYVYNFPIVVYNAKRDDASDFYTYFMERLETSILKFKDKGYKFTTYLTSVLINHYKNFLAFQRKSLKMIYESDLSEYNIFHILSDQEDSSNYNDERLKKALAFFETLDEFSKLIIKTFIFELTPEDIKLISKYTNKPIERVLSEYEEILARVSKKQAKRRKIIQLLQQKPSQKLLDKLKKINTLCGYSDVAKLLNMTVSNVGVSLKRIRDKFKDYEYKNLSTL
ncbi:MAG: sigma-70 family RNA polymerase sigma factor [Spirochaetia bacterium]|nr:sigma-70 family RNA polymerase sigma factor [Spirochaetota bacterium]MDW8113063.1 sigma-70 family RNA polymerase sigma factor [Spirochaetia bacterium]